MIYQIVEVKDWNEWDKKEKKYDKWLGTKYSIVKYKRKGPVIIVVDVPGSEIISDGDVKKQLRECVAVLGDFQDLEDDQYLGKDGVLHYVGSAASVTLVDPALIELGG